MSYAPRSLPPRPYGSRPSVPRPYYGARPPTGFGNNVAAGAGSLGNALGALGGTLGCLLCLASIGALGLFSCVVALTAYTKQFLDNYKKMNPSAGAEHIQIGLMLLVISLMLSMFSRRQ